MTTIRLKGGRVYDPANGVDGEIRDIGIRDGRIVALHPQDKVDTEYDLSGCVVMAGGIDLHTHIGGGKVNLARMMLPEDHRLNRPRDSLLELASNGCCTPGTLETGYRYAQMGYTAAFEPAMLA
ncbi:MAG: amidohydrolase family protein, partial [Thauera sp.]|nr:amidohydrolase family protein [Thauera sp.]